VVLNPGLTGEGVGQGLLWNALLPAYLLPAGLAVGAVWLTPVGRRLLGTYAGAVAFAWVTLQVRQAFHPGSLLIPGGAPAGDAEIWAYSGAWLVLGGGLLALGLRTGQKRLRLAGLGLAGLVTAKVFLLDMAGLQGLWRVLSFLGLGLALIGLGALYRRLALPAAEAAE